MKLTLPCYSYAALSMPFLLFPFHFIHCLSRYPLIPRCTAPVILIQEIFLSQKYFICIYIYTCTYTHTIYMYMYVYLEPVRAFFSKHSCSKCNIKYSSLYQLLLWCTELHLHCLYGTLCLWFGPCLYLLSGHKTMGCICVSNCYCCFQHDHQKLILACVQPEWLGKQNTIYINSSLNDHGVFLSVITTSRW